MACGPFSIHALLAESDRFVTAFRGSVDSFLSTLSLRRATIGLVFLWWGVRFSIHALLAESDQRNKFRDSRNSHFLSTLSLRRATFSVAFVFGFGAFSIHALLAESDVNEDRYGQQYWRFSIHALLAESDNPRVTMNTWQKIFLSTLSLRRATQ